MDETVPTERTALLAREESIRLPLRKRPSSFRTVVSCAVIFLVISIASDIAIAPNTAILEDIICRKYYASSDSSSTWPKWKTSRDGCKIEPVQSEIAFINGWKDTFETIPGMLLAIPYGTLADRIGRKKVLLLAIVGCLLSDLWVRCIYWYSNLVSLRLVWFSALWQIIGAGGATLSSIIFVIVADVCTPDERTAALSQVTAVDILSQLVFIPLGGFFISINPWIPMLISFCAMILGLLLSIILLPDTLAFAKAEGASPANMDNAADLASRHQQRNSWVSVQSVVQNIATAHRWLVENAGASLVLLSFFTFHLGERIDSAIALQYGSKRLNWTIGQASFLLALKAGIVFAIIAIVLPVVSTLLTIRGGWHETTKDKLLTQACCLFLAFGSVVVGLSSSWAPLILGQILFAMGSAFTVPSRSLLAGLVEKTRLGLMFTSMSVLMYAGILIGGPLSAALFKFGQQLGDFWLGLPFLVAGAMFLVCFAAISGTRPRKDENESDRPQENSQ